MERTIRVTVHMDDELYTKFVKLSRKKGMLRSMLIYKIVKEAIEAKYEEEFKEKEIGRRD